MTRRGRSALPRLLGAMVAGLLPLLVALDCVLSYATDSRSSTFSDFDFLIMTLAAIGCLLSGGLVAVVLEGHRGRPLLS